MALPSIISQIRLTVERHVKKAGSWKQKARECDPVKRFDGKQVGLGKRPRRGRLDVNLITDDDDVPGDLHDDGRCFFVASGGAYDSQA